MVNAKITVLLIVAAVLVVAIVGVAFAEFANAQAYAYNGYYQGSQQGSASFGAPYGNGGYGGMGMGMCCRFR